jgi:hypothetical protein
MRSLVRKPAERRIMVMRSKCVLLMNARMPRLSLPKDSSAMASSYCLVSKLRPGQQRHQVLQLAAAKLRGEGDAQHVGVGGVVEVVVDVLEPAHLRQNSDARRPCRPSRSGTVELRRDGQVAEVVDGLAQQVAAKSSLTAIFDMAKSAWDSSAPAEFTRMKISVTVSMSRSSASSMSRRGC